MCAIVSETVGLVTKGDLPVKRWNAYDKFVNAKKKKRGP